MNGQANVQVNFIVIGVQKGGTTALFEYLADEPSIALSRTKEVHFFDDETVNWEAPDYSRYHDQFDADVEGLRGEATPIYIYWPNSLERIAAYNPQIRLILLLRDPVERAWSHWRMEFDRGVETRPFSWCIRQGRSRLFDAEPWGHHREFSYVERGYYGEQIEHLYTLFSPAQVLILRSEDLRRDPNETLLKVNGFLGIPAPAPVEPRDVHVGRTLEYGASLEVEDIAYLRRLYARDAARLRGLTGLTFG